MLGALGTDAVQQDGREGVVKTGHRDTDAGFGLRGLRPSARVAAQTVSFRRLRIAWVLMLAEAVAEKRAGRSGRRRRSPPPRPDAAVRISCRAFAVFAYRR